jgi:hypothetical protein
MRTHESRGWGMISPKMVMPTGEQERHQHAFYDKYLSSDNRCLMQIKPLELR